MQISLGMICTVEIIKLWNNKVTLKKYRQYANINFFKLHHKFENILNVICKNLIK